MSGFTKKAITETFVEMLNSTDFDKITVKDVVERCGINRNTFYYYYQDIYALLNDLIESEVNKAIEVNDEDLNWQNRAVKALKFAIDNKKAVYHIYNSISKDVMVKYFRRITADMSVKFISYVAGDYEIEEDDLMFLSSLLCDAVMGMLIAWLEGGMTEDIETRVAEIQFLFDGMAKEIVGRMKTPEYRKIKQGKDFTLRA